MKKNKFIIKMLIVMILVQVSGMVILLTQIKETEKRLEYHKNKLEQSKRDLENYQKELEANKGFEVETAASIAYYVAAIKTLTECKTEILKLIPSQFDERGERIQ